PGAPGRGDPQILLNGQRCEYLAALWYPADAHAAAPVRRYRRDVRAAEANLADPRREMAGDREHQGRFAGSVAPQHGQRPAGFDRQRQAADHDTLAIADAE